MDHDDERQAAAGSEGDGGGGGGSAQPLSPVQEESTQPEVEQADAEAPQQQQEEGEQEQESAGEPGGQVTLGALHRAQHAAALDPNEEPEPLFDMALGKVVLFPDGTSRAVFTQEEYDQALQVQIPDPDDHFIYPDEEESEEELDPEEQQYLTFKAEHLSR